VRTYRLNPSGNNLEGSAGPISIEASAKFRSQPMPMGFPVWLQMANKSLPLRNPQLLPDFVRNRTQGIDYCPPTPIGLARVFYVRAQLAKQQPEIAPVMQERRRADEDSQIVNLGQHSPAREHVHCARHFLALQGECGIDGGEAGSDKQYPFAGESDSKGVAKPGREMPSILQTVPCQAGARTRSWITKSQHCPLRPNCSATAERQSHADWICAHADCLGAYMAK
jgi:hypothetical protein